VVKKLNIKKCGNVIDEDLNPKVEVKGSFLVFATYDT
jgi:hypothetical protein